MNKKEQFYNDVIKAVKQYVQKYKRVPTKIEVNADIFCNLVKESLKETKLKEIPVKDLTFMGMEIVLSAVVRTFNIK